MLAPTSASSSNKTKEIYLKNVAYCETNLRSELMAGILNKIMFIFLLII